VPDENPAAWRVLEQRQTTEVTAAGTFREVMEVTCETASGVPFTVTVPLTIYSPENVALSAQLRAQEIEAVSRLGNV
jgi:hypothetical protein